MNDKNLNKMLFICHNDFFLKFKRGPTNDPLALGRAKDFQKTQRKTTITLTQEKLLESQLLPNLLGLLHTGISDLMFLHLQCHLPLHQLDLHG